ncbi:MAG: 50S ribosomal protein L23 [Saprospiraceae bacterium]|nr:50S ribosomal protein L23 [Saprospiraceae bacterium]MBK8634846.1 50S ribosomal protein L23 [Saprospiraceae bacterium]HMS68760.1 50S ribosomal protein L23 [Saprospiraceae bacterium]
MARDIIIKPVLSEKADKLSTKSSKYTFVVDRKANKLEIQKALAKLFPSVTILDVNTAVIPGKVKTRNTRSGMSKGRVSGYKKAIVTLASGDELDLFGSEA